MLPYSPAEVALLLATTGVLVYLGAPMLVRYGMTQPAKPSLKPVSAETFAELPADVAAFFERAGDTLTDLGFVPVVHAALPAASGNPNVVAGIFVHPGANDAAMVTVMQPQRHAAALRQAYVEFSTTFVGDKEVNTSNASALDSFRYPPDEKIVVRLPETQSLAALYRIHGMLVERHGGSRRKKDIPADRRCLAIVHASMRRECDQQREVGYLYLDTERQVYRPTWKGAYLMSWGQLWPMTSVRRALRSRRNRQLLAELGLSDIE